MSVSIQTFDLDDEPDHVAVKVFVAEAPGVVGWEKEQVFIVPREAKERVLAEIAAYIEAKLQAHGFRK